MMLSSMPGPTAAHYRAKIAVFLEWWFHRGYEDGIPDEADAGLEASRQVPSWRRVCKTLLRNDYWCKGLSFSQHKDRDSYARYRAIVAKRHTANGGAMGPGVRWEHECGPDVPGRPSAKQLALLAALTGGSTPLHAWRAIGRHVGRSVRSAQRYATRQDASEAIEALRRADAEFRAEKYTNRPKAQRGERVAGLPGENDGTAPR